MLRLRFWLLALSSLLLLSACKADYEYTRGKCYVVFDNSKALVPQLAAAMAGTPSVFCRVWKGSVQGAPAFYFADFTGKQQYVVFNAAQQKATLVFGRNDSSGIIVGHTNFHGFRAFDMQCPVCTEMTDFNPRVPLTWSTESTLTCSKCHHVFDLNNLGYADDGARLTEYRAQPPTGAYGVLYIQ